VLNKKERKHGENKENRAAVVAGDLPAGGSVG
jgi:hypothetical protein